MAKSETLMRSKDVAHILDCTPDDIIVLASSGKLRGSREGRYWRFSFKDVMAYKKQQEKGK